MADKPSLERLASVLAALSETEGRTLREIHVAIGIGARPTVASCLRVLCSEGRARYDGPDGSRIYFRT
ncbi:helix-turn-helix domain-containing protein [Bradyrhizobium lablabi]|jgi:DNA-binding IclR family transcriptional regulator|uniref:helix-turn-helix domain-containing protein n=1 Tax=Bradyrhizobium lablabi TaxID=722472 RepID=UPI0009A7E60D